VLPGLEEAFKREFSRDSKNYDWPIVRHFEHELLGRGMYYNKTYGSCTSYAVYQTTALRAVGIPARMIIVVPAVDASDPQQLLLVRRGLTHHELRQKILRGLRNSRQGFVAHTFHEVYVGGRWHRLDYNELGRGIVRESSMGLTTHLYTLNDLSDVDLASTWGRRYAKGLRCETFKHSNPYAAMAVSDLFGRYAKVANPQIRRPDKPRAKPGIVVMVPADQRDLWKRVWSITSGYTSDKTARAHSELTYEEVFEPAFGLYPEDIVVLLFSLDRPDRVPKTHADLLPRPWPDIEGKLRRGQNVELTGKARGFRVILLAAPDLKRLRQLIDDTKLLSTPKF
jgi:hypothetical protein